MFTGRQFDVETGLYYCRARYYNPYLGRFLQTDPVGYEDGINWYRYCGNNPLARFDPSGMETNTTYVPTTGAITLPNYRVTPELLIFWYGFGYGNTLRFTGTGVNELLLSSTRVMTQLRIWMMMVASSLLRGVFFSGAEAVGSFDTGWMDEFQFDAEASLLHHLLHDVYIGAKGTYVVNRCAYTVTITAKYIIYDYMDLHACSLWDIITGNYGDEVKKYVLPDYPGKKLEQLINLWAWVKGFGRPAQPYKLYLESTDLTTTFYFNLKGGVERIEGFLGPWKHGPD